MGKYLYTLKHTVTRAEREMTSDSLFEIGSFLEDGQHKFMWEVIDVTPTAYVSVAEMKGWDF